MVNGTPAEADDKRFDKECILTSYSQICSKSTAGIFGKYILKFPRMWRETRVSVAEGLITKTGRKPHYGSSH